MSIQNEVSRLLNAKADIKTVLQANGISVSDAATLDAYPELVDAALRSGSTYLCEATFLVDDWNQNSDGNYEQSVEVDPIGGAPNVESSFLMVSGIYVEDTYQDDTQKAICNAGSIIENGRKTIGNGTLTCVTRNGEKPVSDVPVRFLVKNVYSNLIDESMRNGLTYLYKALFLVDDWDGSNTYTQTVSVTPLAGAPDITSDFIMASIVYIEDIYPDDTQQIISESGDVINRGTKTIGDGTFSCTTRSGEKPTSDVQVYFLAKIGDLSS